MRNQHTGKYESLILYQQDKEEWELSFSCYLPLFWPIWQSGAAVEPSLSLSQNLSNPIKVINDTQTPILPTERDEDIMLRLNQLMNEQKIYLDTDLTLDKISRRLIIPVKQISIAINRSTGGNVSRHINKFRIDVASKALVDGENVTSAMLTSGFNTKSNFNREFLRVTGLSPSVWLKKQAS